MRIGRDQAADEPRKLVDVVIERAGGLGPRVYAAAIVCMVFLAIAMAGLLLRSVATAEWAGALFLIGFAALFTWQVGGFITRNRPLIYTFDNLPFALLP